MESVNIPVGIITLPSSKCPGELTNPELNPFKSCHDPHAVIITAHYKLKDKYLAIIFLLLGIMNPLAATQH